MIKSATTLFAVCALLFSPTTGRSAVSDNWSAGANGPHPKAIGISDAAGGQTLTVKLGLEKSVRIHLARFYVSRGAADNPVDLLPEIEICTGKRAQGKRLSLAGPWFDHFDATEAVKDAVAAGEDLNLFVKTFPGWQKDKTRLEVWHEAAGPAPPPAVKEVKAFHRAGQTFITWKEFNPPAASENLTYGQYKQALSGVKDPVRYRIYGHSQPITPKTILDAQFLAEVGPLSAWNANGRNMEYLIGQAMIHPDVMGELAENNNHLMYTWGLDSARMDRYPLSRFVIDESAGPLPPGTGLYVHSTVTAGRRHYAVVSCVNGVENIQDLSGATSQRIEETAGPGEPVCQGDGLWGPFFDYPGRRKVYVQWCAPPLAPLPGMYFNWSVLVPPDRRPALELVGAEPSSPGRPATLRPVELYFHTAGFSYAMPHKKYLLESIQIAPHDVPFSNWYGFNGSWGTLKGFQSGVVGNHTQRRIMAFLEWAMQKFPIDPDRIMAPGDDGAALLALNYPDMFSYVIINKFASLVAPPEKVSRGEPPSMAAAEKALGPVWGPKSPEIKDDQGRSDWGWAMLDKLVAATPARDLPLFSCNTQSWGLFVAAFGKGFGRFYSSMLDARQPLTVNWSWGGDAPLFPDKHTGLWRGIDISRKTPVPAFFHCSADANQDGNGQINGFTVWRSLKETADSFEVVLGGRGATDVAFRRCQFFKPRPGEKLNWEFTPLPDPKARSVPAVQHGQATADADGLVTIPGLALGNGSALKITRGK